MPSDETLNSLYENDLSFRLYADHKYGMSIDELAILTGRSSHWVAERVEAMRLCIEKQVFFSAR
jgi:hypothetical protein